MLNDIGDSSWRSTRMSMTAGLPRARGWGLFGGVDCEGPESVVVRMTCIYFQVRLKR
jgi:hypothetical protein